MQGTKQLRRKQTVESMVGRQTMDMDQQAENIFLRIYRESQDRSDPSKKFDMRPLPDLYNVVKNFREETVSLTLYN